MTSELALNILNVRRRISADSEVLKDDCYGMIWNSRFVLTRPYAITQRPSETSNIIMEDCRSSLIAVMTVVCRSSMVKLSVI